MRRFFIIFVICFTSFLEGGDLVAIFICDTCAEDIEASVLCDLRKMRDEAKRIAGYSELHLREISFNGENLSPKQVFGELKELRIEKEDVIFFYFSGHGYRTVLKDGNPWPNLFFTAARKGVDFNQVMLRLKKKNPRLLISIADCCNNYLPKECAPPVYHGELFGKGGGRIKANYEQLFLKTSGSVIISAADVGEFAWCIPGGALFTKAFIKRLRQETLKSHSANWQTILDKASLDVISYQTPLYLIE